jgi:DnaK suppressor protein
LIEVSQVKILANADSALTLSQLEKLANQLVNTRHELVGMLDALNRQIATKADCSIRDAVEAASLQEEIARASGIADQHNQTISEIDHALRKLESGRYGISEKSGEPIAYQRLSLIPWARTGIED